MSSSLQERWSIFSSRLSIADSPAIWEKLDELYSEKHRHYHNLIHIEDCLNKLDHWPQDISPAIRDTIELAIWFHDAIYDTLRSDNEEISADLATAHLYDHPLSASCHSLILATKHNQPQKISAEKILCDIDLSILGSKPEKYQHYASNIRKEYHWVSKKKYSEGRSKVLSNFLSRKRLYQTSYAIDLWEAQAQANINQELASYSPSKN